MNNISFWLILLGIIILVFVWLRNKWTARENYEGRLQELRARFNILNITIEKGGIPNDNIVCGNTEYALIDSDCGYSLDTPLKMIEKNSSQCCGKTVLIRQQSDSMSTGTAYDFWGIYISTGRIIKRGGK